MIPTRTYRILLPLIILGGALATPLLAQAEFSISGILIATTGFFLYIAASAFDTVMNFFVLQMGVLISTSTAGEGLGASIDKIWTVVRDLVNLTFIFGLVYIGFRAILGADSDTKRMLSAIVICALLVNFSLFISKAVIDVSNITAVEIYQKMGLDEQTRGKNQATLSISEVFLSNMGILSLVTLPNSSTIVAESAGKDLDSDAFLAFVVGATLFILVAAFVFAAGAILLTIRFGILVILMIFSPVAFVAWFFPGIGGWSRWWWKTLFSQAFFAPAYVFMLYITLVVASSYGARTKGFDKIFINDQIGDDGFVTVVFFAVTIVMLVASLIIAKQMGAYGASRAVSTGRYLSHALRRRAQSFGGRYTVGLASQGAGWVNNRLEATRTGRNIKRLVSVASLGTFTERTRRNIFEAGKTAKFGGPYSRADDIRFDEEQTARRGQEERAYEARKAEREGREAADKHVKNGTAPLPGTPDRLAIDALAKAIRDRTDKELADMDIKVLTNEHVAVNLSSKQIEALEKNDKISAKDAAAIKTARKKALIDVVNGTNPAAINGVRDAATLASRGETELAKMPIEVLSHDKMAQYLTPAIVEQVLKDGKADTTQLTALKTNIETEGGRRGGAGSNDPYIKKFDTWKFRSTYGSGFGVTFT